MTSALAGQYRWPSPRRVDQAAVARSMLLNISEQLALIDYNAYTCCPQGRAFHGGCADHIYQNIAPGAHFFMRLF